MAQFRTRELDKPCPQCGGRLVMDEQSLDTDQGPTGRWAALRRRCASRGCPLTIADFPEDYPGA